MFQITYRLVVSFVFHLRFSIRMLQTYKLWKPLFIFGRLGNAKLTPIHGQLLLFIHMGCICANAIYQAKDGLIFYTFLLIQRVLLFTLVCACAALTQFTPRCRSKCNPTATNCCEFSVQIPLLLVDGNTFLGTMLVLDTKLSVVFTVQTFIIYNWLNTHGTILSLYC